MKDIRDIMMQLRLISALKNMTLLYIIINKSVIKIKLHFAAKS